MRRLRTLVAAVSVALVAALGAGAFALVKQRDAADSRDRADIARVAAVSRSVVERQPDLGLLLAVAAFELDDTEETRGALLEGLQTNPLLFGLLHGVDSGLEAAVFSPDGSKLVTPTTDGTGSIVWSTTSRRRLAVLDHGNGILQDAAISPSGRWLAVPAIYEKPRFESRLQVWDLARNRLVRLIHSPAGGLSSAAFSADGDTLITQGGPRTHRPVRDRGCAVGHANLAPARRSAPGQSRVLGRPDGGRQCRRGAPGGAAVQRWCSGVVELRAQAGGHTARHDGAGDGPCFRAGRVRAGDRR